MNKRKRLFKKGIGVLSIITMLFQTVFIAWAGNGPNSNANEEWYQAYIYFSSSPQGNGTYIFGTYPEVVTSEVPGMTYDKSTNTLTISNVSCPLGYLETNMMGEDFKINLIGSNSIGSIRTWGDAYGGSVYLTGDGNLDVNGEGNYSFALISYAEGSNSVIRIGESVSLHVTAGTGKPAVFVSGTTNSSNGIILDNPDGMVGNGNIVSERLQNGTSLNADFYYSYHKANDDTLYGIKMTEDGDATRYSVYIVTLDEDDFPIVSPVDGEQNLSVIPQGYQADYSDNYSWTISDQTGEQAFENPSQEVIISGKTPGNVVRENITWKTAEVTAGSNLSGANTDYSFTLKPDKEFPVTKGTGFSIQLLGADFSNASIVSDDVSIKNGKMDSVNVEFKTDKSISADGIKFTIHQVKNPVCSWAVFASTGILQSKISSADKVTIYSAASKKFNALQFLCPQLTIKQPDSCNMSSYYTVTLDPDSSATTINGNRNQTIQLEAGMLGKKAVVDFYDKMSDSELGVKVQSVTIDTIGKTNLAERTTVPFSGYDVKFKFGDKIIDSSLQGNEFALFKNWKMINPNNGRFYLGDTQGISLEMYHLSDEEITDTYNLNNPTISVLGNTITASFQQYPKTKLEGTVTDLSGGPIAGANVVICQAPNGENYRTQTVITNQDGNFSADVLAGVPANITASKDGYEEETIPAASCENHQNVSLKKPRSSIYVNLGGVKLDSISIRVLDSNGANLSYNISKSSAAYDYVIRLNTNLNPDEEYRVRIASPGLANDAEQSFTAVENINPEVNFKKGTSQGDLSVISILDASEVLSESGRFFCMKAFNSNNGQLIEEKNCYNYSKDNRVSLEEGQYDVILFDSKYCNLLYKDITKEQLLSNLKAGEYLLETVQIKPDETKKLSGTVPNCTADVCNAKNASVQAPKTAGLDSKYKITGSFDCTKSLRRIYLGRNNSNEDSYYLQGISSIVVNGKSIPLYEENINGRICMVAECPSEAGWTGKINFSCYMNTNSEYVSFGSAMGYDVCADFNGIAYDENLGYVNTLITPELTLNVTNKTESNQNVAFSGTAEAKKTVKIYDNGLLTAVVTADSSGKFKGTFDLKDENYFHVITAQIYFETMKDDETIRYPVTTQKTLSYVPNEAVLTELKMGDRNLPLDGSQTAYYLNELENGFSAKIGNSELLNTVSCITADGKLTEGKAFLCVKTTNKVYMLPMKQSGDTFKTGYFSFGDEYPVSTKVYYSSKTPENAKAYMLDGKTMVSRFLDSKEPAEEYEELVEGVVKDLTSEEILQGYKNGTISEEDYVAQIYSKIASGDERLREMSASDIGTESDPSKATVTIYSEYLTSLPNCNAFDSYLLSGDDGDYQVYSKVSFYDKHANAAAPVIFEQHKETTELPAYRDLISNPNIGSVLQEVYRVAKDSKKKKIVHETLLFCMPGAKSPLASSANVQETKAVTSSVAGKKATGICGGIDVSAISSDTWSNIGTTALTGTLGAFGSATKNEYWVKIAVQGKEGGKITDIAVNLNSLADNVGNGIDVTNLIMGIGGTNETKLAKLGQMVDEMRSEALNMYKATDNPALKSQIKNFMSDLDTTAQNVGWADAQNTFTSNSTGAMDVVGTSSGFIPGWGWISSTAIGGGSCYLKAANDTQLKNAMDSFQETLMKFYGVRSAAQADFEKTEADLEEEDANLAAVHDPSGYVYEAVASNRVEGATVRLYYNGYNEATSRYIPKYEDGLLTNNYVEGGFLKKFVDVYGTSQENPLITNAQGKYAWDVPQGLWYVTAEKDGYEPGSSQNDKAAVVSGGAYNWLPVLPPQLDVNIGLVSHETPAVSQVMANTDGVYISFSKYLDETNLTDTCFKLTDEDGNNIPFTLQKRNSEESPTLSGVSYTSRILLSSELVADSKVNLVVDGSLTSYAGEAMNQQFSGVYSVTNKQKLASVKSNLNGGTVALNSSLELSADEGAVIYYTTDGTLPSQSNGKIFEEEITISQDMTVKAVAVKDGYFDSNVLTLGFKVKQTVFGAEEEKPFKIGDFDENGDVNLKDANMILKASLLVISITERQTKISDINQDGTVNLRDANIALKMALKII